MQMGTKGRKCSDQSVIFFSLNTIFSKNISSDSYQVEILHRQYYL